MDNTTEEKNTQPWPCTSDEACCCDPVAEQAPVTVDMIEEAYNRLEELVNQCKTPVILHIKIEKGESVNSRTSTCKAVTKMAGAKSTEMACGSWLLGSLRNLFLRQSRNYFFGSEACF